MLRNYHAVWISTHLMGCNRLKIKGQREIMLANNLLQLG